MKILLIGNYINNEQQSMQRFADLMLQGLESEGHEVRLVRPPVVLGRLRRGDTGLAKWIGYIDRFLLYPMLLRRQVRWADVVHICDQANSVYIPHLRGKPHVLTIHDMLAIRSALGEISDSPTGLTGRIYQRWILRNLSKAHVLVCVSHQTQKEVRRHVDLPVDRLIVVSNALNYAYRQMPFEELELILRDMGLKQFRPFFLHVGGNQWYKNRQGVLRIFAKLTKKADFQSHKLVMAGKPWTCGLHQLARSLGIQERVVELVDISNEQLCALYSSAEALLFPSLYEGFGWPIIEAQASGCLVITSNRPPMTDIGGKGAIYFDPLEEESGVELITTSLIDVESTKASGFKNARRYTKEAMISGYIDAYEKSLKIEQ